METLANQAASTIEIAHLHHSIDQQQQELREAPWQSAGSSRTTAMEEAISAWAQEIDEQNVSRQTIDAMKAEVAHAHDALLPLLDLAHESQANWGVHDLNALLTTVVEASALSVVGGRV